MGTSREALQASVLRALADRIEGEDAPIPSDVFAPLEALAHHDPNGGALDAEQLSPDEWERVWSDELDRRLENVRTGQTKPLHAAQALAEIRADLARRRRTG